ncbi:MAG TPA: aminotransferase class V-fold PLP-dependent enzyme [Miltoncostaeaceae bacterium]|nr:aminotransferase class V-fold PLP-dependent enzyme [Miltoncostaeaceae bacterium]
MTSPRLPDVRAQLPALASTTYLNSGAIGPLCLPAARALADWAEAAPHRARGSLEGFGRISAQAAAVRAAAGLLVGAGPESVALTANTTHGINLAAWGIDWRPGDEIVTTALEHPGLAVPLAVVARRSEARLRVIGAERAGGDLEGAVAEVAGPRTRLVALSHVSWATGAVLDVAGAARAARAAGALVAVDGAQAVGTIPVDAAALGADVYAFPAHKWLLGPEGLGALWVRPGAMERIDLTVAGLESAADGRAHGEHGAMEPHPSARRYEASTLPAALLPAWEASMAWLAGLGWPWIHGRVAEARAATREALGAIPGVHVLTPPGPQAGLVTFTVAGTAPAGGAADLAAGGVVVRSLPRPEALRASVGFFTDDADIARLAAGVAALSSC